MEKSAAQDMKSLLVANGMTSRPAGRVYERRFASVDSMPQTQTVYKMIYEQKKRGGKQ